MIPTKCEYEVIFAMDAVDLKIYLFVCLIFMTS